MPLPYNQGLRKPSGGLPFEIKKSLSNEIIPATACSLEVSWGRGVRGRERRTGVEQLVPTMT